MAHKARFQLNGKDIPSVTTFLGVIAKPHLYRWYATFGWDECERVKRQSAAFGSQVHDLIEKNFPRPVVDGSRAAECASLAIKFARRAGLELDMQEQHLVCEKYKFHGTTDGIGRLRGRPVVADWKTSNSVHAEMGLQLGAYALAYNEHETDSAKRIEMGLIVRMEKDPAKRPQLEYKLFDLRPTEPYIAAARTLYEWSRKH